LKLPDASLRAPSVSVYTVPTDTPESDGTFEWRSTTLVVVELEAGGQHGIGYTYADKATGMFVREILADVIEDRDAMDIPGTWNAMNVAVRNLGRRGVAAMAISAVDNALWDLKAKLLAVPLLKLLGAARNAIRIYGSGGFTSYGKIHVLRQCATQAPAFRLGRAGHRDGEDEDWPCSGE